MDKIIPVKFRVRRLITQKGKRQSFMIELTYGRLTKKLTMPVHTYETTNNSLGLPVSVRIKPLMYKERQQAEQAAQRLHQRINRPLPGGITTLEWVRREAAKLAV